MRSQIFTNVILKVCKILRPISKLAMIKFNEKTPEMYESVMVFHTVMVKENGGRETNFMWKFISESFWGGMKNWPLGEGFEYWRCWLIDFALNQPGCQSANLLLSIPSWKFVLFTYYARAISGSPEAAKWSWHPMKVSNPAGPLMSNAAENALLFCNQMSLI